jgi:hypothetical protein|tara:strand:+ start:2053 stop:2325 length:273 start_codon:yes stop_codon:yes gene_type:complete
MKINPRNFHPRKLITLPPHFATMDIGFKNDGEIDILARWIYQNCYSRFAVVKQIKYNKDKIDPTTVVGFEEPSDLTLFALSGPIHKRRAV